MTLPTWPNAINIAQISWWLEYNTRSFVSPLTKSVQTIETPGARWKASVKLQNLDRTEWACISAFLNNLRGMAGRFYFSPVHAAVPLLDTSPPSGVTVLGGSQTGTTLITQGWPSSSTVLAVGDFFAVTTTKGTELKQVTETVVSTASGQASITFCPTLRNAPADGSSVVLTSPTCIMMLDDDEQNKGTFTPPVLGAYTIDMTEVIYA